MSKPEVQLQGFGFNDKPRLSWIFIVLAVIVVTAIIIAIIVASGKHAAAKDDEDAQKSAAVAEGAKTLAKELPTEKSAATEKKTKTPAAPKVEEPKAPATQPLEVPAKEVANAAEAKDFLERAFAAEKSDDLLQAREILLAAIAAEIRTAEIEKALGKINVELITSRRMMPEKIEYIVAEGDAIKRIANRFNTTQALIVEANKVPRPDRIQPGDSLRILNNARFEVVVNRNENWMLVFMNGKFFKRYKVGTGRYDSTPLGTYRINDRMAEPIWWKPDGTKVPYGDKENILGTRWLALEATGDTPHRRGYGIHGTWDDTTIGTQSSSGCVRMINKDIEELFSILPLGTEVRIIEK